MKVTQDDAARFSVENTATGVWIVVGLLALGAFGSVGLVTYLTGVLDPLQVQMAVIFVAVLVPFLIAASPSVALSFEHGPQELRIRRSWPLFSSEKTIAFSALQRVDVEQRYNQGVSRNFTLVMRLRDGTRVWLGQMTWHDEKNLRAQADRMNTVLGVPPKKVRRKGTGRVAG